MGRRELTIPEEMQARKSGEEVEAEGLSVESWKIFNYPISHPIPNHPIDTRPPNPACPWLPEISETHDFSLTRRHGHVKGAEFYLDALRYAQSQWISGKPAQAILQLNKAWMADLKGDESILKIHPSPYRALLWIVETASTGNHGYLGNPVRHFQHLASRMSGPRAEIRSWRAWLCFHLAEKILNPADYPRDGEQIAREGIWIPGFQRARNEISRSGWIGEACALDELLLPAPATA